MNPEISNSYANFAKQLKSYSWLLHKVSGDGDNKVAYGLGSGFAVRIDEDTRTKNQLQPNDLIILTCDHVLPADDEIVRVRNFNHKTSFNARILRRNRSWDIALLVLQNAADKFASAEFVEDGNILLSQPLFHVGNPGRFLWSFFIGCAGNKCTNDAVAPSRRSRKKCFFHKPDLNETASHLKLGDFVNKKFFARPNLIGENIKEKMKNLNPSVPVIQCCGMGTAEGCSGGPVFNNEGKIVGMMGFNLVEFDIVSHVSMLKAYVYDPLC
ncbi:uncharacterized protein LOC131610717 [Vicia villosa]|uniref:uncharacterized protein LOC131610717 n=1 Tax=Vicia villosa TaxID=3911 RepID=UPI00273B98D4|nr:uncharacterized protein LOC131610717 [Vicia villosa]